MQSAGLCSDGYILYKFCGDIAESMAKISANLVRNAYGEQKCKQNLNIYVL